MIEHKEIRNPFTLFSDIANYVIILKYNKSILDELHYQNDLELISNKIDRSIRKSFNKSQIRNGMRFMIPVNDFFTKIVTLLYGIRFICKSFRA